MYREALVEHPIDRRIELVALCDVNAARLALAASHLDGRAADRRRPVRRRRVRAMVAERRPDVVIVTTPDYLHDTYIVRALRAGCDVITEKPMTIDLDRLKRIVDAQRETGRAVTVTFNYRYNPATPSSRTSCCRAASARSPPWTSGGTWTGSTAPTTSAAGTATRSKSGGLLVHKATHHFDLANWWVASRPETVTALGLASLLRPGDGRALGLGGHGERCHTCPKSVACPYRLDLDDDPELKSLYLDAEGADGYIRDRCIFSSEISIEDTMQVQVGYANGVSMNYTLCAYSPWEGYEIVFYGTDGELNHRHVGVHGIFGGTRHEADDSATTTILHRHGEAPAPWTSGPARGITAGEIP